MPTLRTALVVVAAALLVGCSGSDGSDSAERPSTTTRASTTTTTAGRPGRTTTTTTTTVVAPPSTTTTRVVPPPTTPTCTPFAGADVRAVTGVGGVRYLTDASITSDGCVDRVVFGFEPGRGAPGATVRAGAGPFRDSSGRATTVAGTRFLVVRLHPARIARISPAGVVETYVGADRISPTGPTVAVREMAMYGTFEGNVRFVVGLDGAHRARVALDGDRVVVTVER